MTDYEKYLIKQLGAEAKQYRKRELKKSAVEMGRLIGISEHRVRIFERGLDNSATILLGYIKQGFEVSYEILNSGKYNKNVQ